MELNGYKSMSHRVAASFLRNLAEFKALPGGTPVESRVALHDFFKSLYTKLFEQPELFALPMDPDAVITVDEPEVKEKKQEVRKKLDKSRNLIAGGIDYLMLAGIQGRLEGDTLILQNHTAAVKETKANKKFLAALSNAGLYITVTGDTANLRSEQFPDMMPALQELAQSCSRIQPAETGKFQFTRCDYCALQGEGPDPAELIEALDSDTQVLVKQAHDYFISRDYKTQIWDINSRLTWSIKYQGDRKVKATPLFQINYDTRYAQPVRLQIKCASSGRIVGLLPEQSQSLQKDFFHRTYICNGDKCGWCRNKKTMGPSVIQFNNEEHTVCWYVNPDIREINSDTIELIKEYEQLHVQLGG